MKIFPSKNEKIVTVAILSFMTGSILISFSLTKIQDKNLFLTAITTLVAAFIGAWTAYKLADNKKKREYEQSCIDNANNILFALYERIRALMLVQDQSINPHRAHNFRMILIMPTLSLSYPESKLNIESLMFILGTKYKQLILDLQTEKECFNVAFNIIKFRSDLHFHHVQPAMEAGGIQEGGEYTREQLTEVVGERIFSQLERSTNNLIEQVDRTIESGIEAKSRLVKALKELFPDEFILDFEFHPAE